MSLIKWCYKMSDPKEQTCLLPFFPFPLLSPAFSLEATSFTSCSCFFCLQVFKPHSDADVSSFLNFRHFLWYNHELPWGLCVYHRKCLKINTRHLLYCDHVNIVVCPTTFPIITISIFLEVSNVSFCCHKSD